MEGSKVRRASADRRDHRDPGSDAPAGRRAGITRYRIQSTVTRKVNGPRTGWPLAARRKGPCGSGPWTRRPVQGPTAHVAEKHCTQGAAGGDTKDLRLLECAPHHEGCREQGNHAADDHRPTAHRLHGWRQHTLIPFPLTHFVSRNQTVRSQKNYADERVTRRTGPWPARLHAARPPLPQIGGPLVPTRPTQARCLRLPPLLAIRGNLRQPDATAYRQRLDGGQQHCRILQPTEPGLQVT
jgi:hypothetical protein